MIEHVTTNIRLPKGLYRELKRRALDEEKSLAEIVRESLAQYLAPSSASMHVGSAAAIHTAEPGDSLWAIGTDPAFADVTDGSVNHDLHLLSAAPTDTGTTTGGK